MFYTIPSVPTVPTVNYVITVITVTSVTTSTTVSTVIIVTAKLICKGLIPSSCPTFVKAYYTFLWVII